MEPPLGRLPGGSASGPVRVARSPGTLGLDLSDGIGETARDGV